MRILKQVLTLMLVLSTFFSINLCTYTLVTSRCGINFGTKIIEPQRYLPFDSASEIVRIQTDVKLEGDIPTIDGAAALLPVYSAIVNAVYPSESVVFDGERYSIESSIVFTDTIKAYQGVVDGANDIILCAAPSEQQQQYAEEKGVELVCTPIGYEAFVFFVNENNPIDSLTVEQIRDIFSGEITNWSEVGGPNRPINPLDRPEGSGSQTVMLKFMDGKEIKKNPLALIGGSVGFSFRYYVDCIVANEGVKMLSVNGIYPSEDNIRNGSYPIIQPFYAIYRADNNNENLQKLIDFILSDEGQYIIDKSGYTSIK